MNGNKRVNDITSIIFILSAISIISMGFLLIYSSIKFDVIYIKMVLIPMGIAIIISGISYILISTNKKEKESIDDLAQKLYYYSGRAMILIFILAWFGFLNFMLYSCLTTRNFEVLPYSIPFWIAGFYLIYTFVKKQDNN